MTLPKARLGDVVDFLDHLRRPITLKDRVHGDVPYYGANGPQGLVKTALFNEPLVLLAEDGGHFDEPEKGIAYLIDGPSWVNNHAHVLRPKPEIDVRYLSRVLENMNVSAFVSGTTRAKLTKGRAEEIEIFLPPLPDQRRIASILDEADELRAKRRAAIEANQALVGGALLQTVRSTGALAPLGDLVRDLRYGTSAKSGSTGMPVLRIPNVSRRELDLGDLKFVDLSAAETERLRLKVGDLLLVRSNGNPDIVGATVRFDPGEDERTFVYASYLIRIRLKESINSTFLAGYLGSELGRAALRRGARTSAGQYNINTQALKALSVPLPDMPMQKAYAESVARIQRITVTMRTHLAKLDELFASLQYRAFRGEL